MSDIQHAGDIGPGRCRSKRTGTAGGSGLISAVALGARAVLVGRPHVWGLAVGGEAGAREVIENLAAELDLTLGLSGRRSLAELDPSVLADS